MRGRHGDPNGLSWFDHPTLKETNIIHYKLDLGELKENEYRLPLSKKDVNGKAKASTTIKNASKPNGVSKTKASPNKKEQIPAQLKPAAAKTHEPAKPKATKKTTKRSTKNQAR